MKKKIEKKLFLSKRTIAVLNRAQMWPVFGGNIDEDDTTSGGGGDGSGNNPTYTCDYKRTTTNTTANGLHSLPPQCPIGG
jgi:hypothetical protein